MTAGCQPLESVPEGHLIVARQFTGGTTPNDDGVPLGTPETVCISVVSTVPTARASEGSATRR